MRKMHLMAQSIQRGYYMVMLETLKNRTARLLRQSEKYTKTDMLYLTKGGFWLSIGLFASSLSSFLLSVAFANLLPPEVFGTYKYIISAAAILTIPTLAGINKSLSQAIARGYEGSLLPGIMMRLRWGALGSVGSLAVAAYYFLQGNNELALAFAIVAPFIPLFETLSMYGSLFQGRKMFRESSLYFLVTRFVYVASLLLTILLTDNLYIILVAYFVPLTIVHLVLLLFILRRYPPNTEREGGTLRTGVHISFNGIIGNVGTYLDSILLWHYLGPVGVAVYSFAVAPVNQVKATYKELPALAVPKLSMRTAREINYLLIERMLKLFGVGVAMAAIYIFAAPYIYRLLFPEYIESIFYSQVFAALLAIQLPLTFLGAAVQSRLHVTPSSWLYLRNIPSGVFIIAAVVLTPLYGILGIIASRALANVTSFLVLGGQWVSFVSRENDGESLQNG